MPRLDKETKERIKKLDYKDLQDIVISLATKEKTAYEYILLNYLDKESGEQDLFEATKADLEIIFQCRLVKKKIQVVNYEFFEMFLF